MYALVLVAVVKLLHRSIRIPVAAFHLEPVVLEMFTLMA
jgi:hypothetical protein